MRAEEQDMVVYPKEMKAVRDAPGKARYYDLCNCLVVV